MLTNIARFILYGKETYDMKRKPTLWTWIWGHGQNLLRRRIGLHEVSAPGLVDFARHYLDQYVFEWLGIGGRTPLPAGWPKDVFATVDRIVRARGGQLQIGDVTVPAFSLNRQTALTLTTMWVAYVDFGGDTANFDAVQRLETALEDAIARECRTELNVRILTKPARIEIDRTDTPTITLRQYWPDYLNGTVSKLRYLCGIHSAPAGDVIVENRLDNSNEYSIAFFGRSGSGKTQALTSAVFTACATTSPEELAVIVIDPKGIDLPITDLPHLSCPVITDTNQARQAVLEVANILKQRATAKVRDAAQRRILIVVDEIKYLLSQQEDDSLIDSLADIAAMGRAWGISIFAGSQRGTNEFFPKRVHSQFPAKWIGAMVDKAEAQFAGGTDCDAHRLPGRGAAMLYEPDGVTRIQSTFVGDASKPDYPKVIGGLVFDIAQRWRGASPHWRLGEQADDSNVSVAQIPNLDAIKEAVRQVLLEMADVRAVETSESDGVMDDETTTILNAMGDELLDALYAEYEKEPTRFNRKRMRDVMMALDMGRLSTAKENNYYDAFMEWVS